MYTSYDRVKAALEHKELDMVPFDLGATIFTGMNIVLYKKIRNVLGLPEKEPEIYCIYQQLAKIDEDVAEALKIDVRGVYPNTPKNGLVKQPVKEGSYYVMVDELGITWNMPVDGYYYDMKKYPFSDVTTIDEAEKYPWPDPEAEERFFTLKERADDYVFNQKKAYVLGRHQVGVLETCLRMRGYDKFYMDLALEPGFAEALLDIALESKMKYWKKALDTVGENVLIVNESDDLGSQNNLFMSLDMYKRYIFPRHKKLFEFIKKNAKSKVYLFYHSCGAIRKAIPLLIEAGVDILNPVQVSAAGMDSKELKRDFGKDITFWGGGMNTQNILPYGTKEEIEEEVKRRIDDFAPGGGFIFTPVHNCQGDVKPENYMAMWKAFQNYRSY